MDQLSRYMAAMLIKTTPYLTTEIIQFDQLMEFTKRISATQQNISVDGILTTGSWSVLQRFLSDNFPKYVPERVGYFGYYSASAVCLPRYFKLQTGQFEVNAISPVIMSFNFIALLYICAAYAAIYKRTYSGNMAVDTAQRQQTEQRQKNAKKMQRKISILIFTDLWCWLPVCLMSFVSLRKSGMHGSVYSFSAIFLLPINSSLNPIIYTDAVPKLYTKLKQIGLQVRTLVNNEQTQITATTEFPNVATTSV
uniref:relaxin receptor 1-like n=1 Tax=Ciona intestinalis TaxID=7719 RepID=UPI000EF44015|nr:relaxin receptor 1-like [Ciona intestinalis]|eukprot:XP_009862083.2 relaxin receptor 1-like [Ciona intestinalis]